MSLFKLLAPAKLHSRVSCKCPLLADSCRPAAGGRGRGERVYRPHGGRGAPWHTVQGGGPNRRAAG
eukprot:scaffold617189_cov53-Prasinocladus_malaysianus.AAC.1